MKKIKELLNQNSYSHLNDDKAFKYFRKSEFYQYLKEDLKKYKDEEYEINKSVRHYADKFCEATRFLNLF